MPKHTSTLCEPVLDGPGNLTVKLASPATNGQEFFLFAMQY
jgi:hypothetical protein